MKFTFLEAAQEVTGSCDLVETAHTRFMVDCGLFQGGPDAREKNLTPWPVDSRFIDFVILTHAHVDHRGLLPGLCAHGIRGPLFTTTANADLLSVMLPDSAYLQENEAARANRTRNLTRRARRRSATREFSPLYTVAQTQSSLAEVRGVPYEARFNPHESVGCRLRDTGQSLDSADRPARSPRARAVRPAHAAARHIRGLGELRRGEGVSRRRRHVDERVPQPAGGQ